MIKWFFLLIFTTGAMAYTLHKEYQFSDNTVLSTHLFPDVPKRFELFRIPSDKIIYRIDAQVVAKSFELNGITIETGKIRYVTFVKKSPIDLTSLKIQLIRSFQERYPTIAIESVHIVPRGYLEALPAEPSAVLEETFYRNAEGTFYVVDSNGIRRYFDYSIHATLGVLHTIRKVLRKEPLSGMNAVLKPVAFESFNDTPLTAFPNEVHRFRASLKQNSPLTLRNIEKIPLVLKNDNVVVVVRNGAVVLELIATATQEGGLYDIITIQKRDGKRSRAKVIGEKRVELQ